MRSSSAHDSSIRELYYAHLEVVVVKSHGPALVTVTGQVHHSRSLGGKDLAHDQLRQKEMRHVISGELALNAIRCQRERLRHDPSIIDYHVNTRHVVPAVDFCSCRAHAVERAEIDLQFAHGYTWCCFFQGLLDFVELGWVAACDDYELWLVQGDDAGGLEAQGARCDAGYEDCWKSIGMLLAMYVCYVPVLPSI